MSWSAPPPDVSLGTSEIHVWRASLAGAAAPLRPVLSEDERARADRFVQQRHRDRFVVGRAFLRDALARYLGVTRDAVRFRYEPAGRAVLDGPGPRFNLSHSADLALLAVTPGRDVGIDLEALRRVPDALDLAERWFAPGERAVLRGVPAADREAAFLRCWTLKESYVKAVGGGLGIPLDRFEVEFVPPSDAPALRVLDEPGASWSLRTIDPGPGFVGALAVRGEIGRLALYDWTRR
jgi:4'-phosphopantetheinyl transferase